MKRFSDGRIFALVCANTIFYIFILVFDIAKAGNRISYGQGVTGDLLKYAAIISCLLICIFALSHERKKVATIQMIVFFFTLAADFFLLFTDFFAIGVLFFMGAHATALYRYKPKWLIPVGVVAASLFIAILFILPGALRASANLTLVVASCVAYAILIISVTISTFYSPQPRNNEVFSRLGMLLFLGCDANVVFFNSLPAGSALHTASIVLMWLFYLPAQTLLALSATDLPLIRRIEPDNAYGETSR